MQDQCCIPPRVPGTCRICKGALKPPWQLMVTRSTIKDTMLRFHLFWQLPVPLSLIPVIRIEVAFIRKRWESTTLQILHIVIQQIGFEQESTIQPQCYTVKETSHVSRMECTHCIIDNTYLIYIYIWRKKNRTSI